MPESKQTLATMAAEIFELHHLVASLRSRLTSGQEDLSETEFLTLDVLATEGPLIIGEVQQRVGVAPAQMSRIVRSLEEHGGRGYVACTINPKDRRCIDIAITKEGSDAHAKYRDARLGTMMDILTILPPEDRVQFMRILGQIRDAFVARLRGEIGKT